MRGDMRCFTLVGIAGEDDLDAPKVIQTSVASASIRLCPNSLVTLNL